MQQSKKHHYAPAFYLKQWSGDDGQVCEFSFQNGKTVARRCHPNATGYVKDLYTTNKLDETNRAIIEDLILARVDERASVALKALLRFSGGDFPFELRQAWAQFILSLHHRSPTSIKGLRDRSDLGLAQRLRELELNYEDFKRPGDPGTFAELKLRLTDKLSDEFFVMLFNRLLVSENILKLLCSMRWDVMTLPSNSLELLTSDRPMIRTNSLTGINDHVAVPLSPFKLFVAMNDRLGLESLIGGSRRRLVAESNDFVCRAAYRFVYGRDRRQERFISNRFIQRSARLT